MNFSLSSHLFEDRCSKVFPVFPMARRHAIQKEHESTPPELTWYSKVFSVFPRKQTAAALRTPEHQ